MKNVTFIVAIDSYIIRKGIVSILKNISGSGLMLETSNVDVLKNQLKEFSSDFIIVSEVLFQKSKQLFDNNISLYKKTILLRLNKEEKFEQNAFTSILLSDTKNQIINQLESLIAPYLIKKKTAHNSVLSEREITVLKFVSTGLTNKQIADQLFLSLHTITTHRKNIGNKLGIKSVSGLTVYAIINNIISIEDIANTTR